MKNSKPEHSAEKISRRLRQLRNAYNLRPSEIADRLNLSRSQWALYENGDRRISIERAVLVCEMFHVNLDWLYRGITDSLKVSTLKRLENPLNPWEAIEKDGAADD